MMRSIHPLKRGGDFRQKAIERLVKIDYGNKLEGEERKNVYLSKSYCMAEGSRSDM